MKRRNVLKRAGIGFAAATGVAGTAGASHAGRRSRTLEQHPAVDPETVRAAVAEDTALLERLAADGVIDAPSVEALDFEATVDDEQVVITDRLIDDGPTRRLSYALSVEAGELTVGVRPDDGTAVAILFDGSDRTVYTEDEDDCYCADPCCCYLMCGCCCQYDCSPR